ncbi:MAG: winged helix-turn-helix transcriptional regulator [Candidatus Micrarchaeia archaeon]|jgi:DNA-binding Lrp family transcriptional regulator
MHDLDSIDRKLLAELDQNSRQAYSSLAKRLRTNKDTVKYRLQKLVDLGIIRGFYTVIDYSKLGLLSFRCYFKLSDAPNSKKEEMITYLKNHKNISIFYRITGHYDFSFSTWVTDPWEYELFWQGFKDKFGQYILDSHLAIKTKYTEFTRNYLSDLKENKMDFTVFQKVTKEDVDELDLKLLNVLSKDARIQLTALAEKTGTSIVTCNSRLKKLIKNKVILGFRTIFDLGALGYEYYKVDLWFSKPENKAKFISTVLSHPNVIYTETTVVTSDFEFDLEVKNFRHFMEIMDGFEREFPDSIKKYEYYSLVQNYKVRYFSSV